MLVIGVIHGDEDAGTEILDRLGTLPVPDDVDLWLVESMNPDGQSAGRRTNANQVDLNRNFPRRWAPLGQPGDWEYAGTGAASEPETAAMVAFISSIEPDLAIWYHQDLFRIAPAQGRGGQLRRQYARADRAAGAARDGRRLHRYRGGLGAGGGARQRGLHRRAGPDAQPQRRRHPRGSRAHPRRELTRVVG